MNKLPSIELTVDLYSELISMGGKLTMLPQATVTWPLRSLLFKRKSHSKRGDKSRKEADIAAAKSSQVLSPAVKTEFLHQ